MVIGASPARGLFATLPTMQVTSVDPRDANWEVETPRYRVYFWTSDAASSEYELTGGDVQDVLEWAERHRGRRTYTLYACVDENGMGLVRLAGVDPTAAR